jgi:bacilysin biosynthesis protein BacA
MNMPWYPYQESEHRNEMALNATLCQDVLLKRSDVLVFEDAPTVLDIATLGPTGTSSQYAAQKFIDYSTKNHKCSITLYDSYEEANDFVLSGQCNALLVANAYKGVDKFYTSKKLKLFSAFKLNTPSYGIATKRDIEEIPEKSLINLHSHHATFGLIPYFLTNKPLTKLKVVEHKSTSLAAIAARYDESFCIANAIAISKYGLHFVSKTRSITMLWSVFLFNK